MPRSATGANSASRRVRRGRDSVAAGPGRRASGFTLIEILVVVVIGAVMTGLVVLALGRASPAAVHERALSRVDAAMTRLCDRALLTGNPHGLRFHDAGYDFWVLRAEGWTAPAGDAPPPGSWPNSQQPRIRIARAPLRTGRVEAPQVLCTGIEPPTPFEIEFGHGESRRVLAWP